MKEEREPEEGSIMPEQTKKVDNSDQVLLAPEAYIYSPDELDQMFTSYVILGEEVIGRLRGDGCILLSLVDMS